MSDAEQGQKAEIEALLTERKKYEAWLAQLEARRATAAEHVFTRVFADYTGRLESVRTKLGERAEALESMVADLEKRLGHEQDKITAKTDERAEAELRAMVGEFEDKEWENTRSRLDSSIKSLRSRFDATERELADLKGLLQSVHGAPAAARPSVMQAAAEGVEEALGEEMTPAESEGAPLGGVEPAIQEPESVPEFEDTPVADSGVIEAPVPESQAAPETLPESEPAAASLPASEPPRAPTPFDELAFLKSVASTPTSPKGMATVSPGSGDHAEPASAMDEPAARPRTSSSKTVDAEPAPLGAPTPRTSQAIRSLKCGECGTLNFPTEWYCERCGGELAAF